jgi:hypothetical protein
VTGKADEMAAWVSEITMVTTRTTASPLAASMSSTPSPARISLVNSVLMPVRTLPEAEIIPEPSFDERADADNAGDGVDPLADAAAAEVAVDCRVVCPSLAEDGPVSPVLAALGPAAVLSATPAAAARDLLPCFWDFFKPESDLPLSRSLDLTTLISIELETSVQKVQRA